MHSTPVSLLLKLKRPADQDAWQRFAFLYTPILLTWAGRLGLQEADAVDLVQEVFLVLYRKLPEFTYDHGGSFRAWLRKVLVNKWRERARHQAALPLVTVETLPEPVAPEPADDMSEAEYRERLVGRAVQLMQTDFQPTTWRACWETVVHSRPAANVAAELGLTVRAVYLARARVLRRLRQELDGLLD